MASDDDPAASGPTGATRGELARTLVSHPIRVLVAIALTCAVAGILTTRLDTDMSVDKLYGGLAEQREIDQRFEQRFGNPDNDVVILLEADDVTSPESLDAQAAVQRALEGRPYVQSITSITTLPVVEGELRLESALADITSGRARIAPALRDRPATANDSARVRAALERSIIARSTLVSEDRTLAAVVVRIGDDIDSDREVAPVVSDLLERVERAGDEAGVELMVAGLPYLRTWLIQQVDRDQYTLFPASIAMVLLLLLVTFRWWPALVLPALAVGISALLIVGTMAAVGEPLNIINNIVPILIIIVGISDSIHLINRYGEELATGVDRKSAAEVALRSMALALLLTSLTTAAGFASLAVSRMEILQRFGITAAIGMLIAYLVAITLLPAALGILPRPRRPIADHSVGPFERLTGLWVRMLVARAVPVLLASALIMAACVYVALGMQVDNHQSDQYDADDAVAAGLEALDHRITGIMAIEITLTAPDQAMTEPAAVAALDRVSSWARELDGVGAVVGYSDFLRHIWGLARRDADTAALVDAPIEELRALSRLAGGAARRFVTADGDSVRLTVFVRDIGGRALMHVAEAVRQRLRRALEPIAPVTIEMSGDGYVSSTGLAVVTRDLMTSLLLASVVIFAFLTLMLRSLRLGLLSIPPNILPLVFTMAYMRVRGITLNPATVIIFSISIGLAVDGTIHVLARFREELRSGKERRVALAVAAMGTGKAVLVSYLSLILGFLILQLSGFVPIRLFGELISVTVFGCLLSTLLVLPPLVAVFGPGRRPPG